MRTNEAALVMLHKLSDCNYILTNLHGQLTCEWEGATETRRDQEALRSKMHKTRNEAMDALRKFLNATR